MSMIHTRCIHISKFITMIITMGHLRPVIIVCVGQGESMSFATHHDLTHACRIPSQSNLTTTNVPIPPFTAQPDSVYAVLELPAIGVLHVPFVAVLRIHNRHPWKTLDAHFQLEPSDHFVVSGLRSGTLPLLVGGSEERIPFNMIPISCGVVRLPTFKITHRKKETSTQVKEGEEIEKRYPVIDGRLEERNERTEEVHLDQTIGKNDAEGIYMSIFPA